VPELNREIARRPRKELLQRLAAAGAPLSPAACNCVSVVPMAMSI
jgi:hypothetical protein